MSRNKEKSTVSLYQEIKKKVNGKFMLRNKEVSVKKIKKNKW